MIYRFEIIHLHNSQLSFSTTFNVFIIPSTLLQNNRPEWRKVEGQLIEILFFVDQFNVNLPHYKHHRFPNTFFHRC
jgi:hypothetical protein